MATENKGIYFTELTLKNVRCFGEEAVLKLSNEKGGWTKWNVILGDNGTGKTTLLQCLAGMEIDPNYLFGIESGKRLTCTSFFKFPLISDFRTTTPVFDGSNTEISAKTIDTLTNLRPEIYAKQFSFETRPAQTGWTKDSFINDKGEMEFFIIGYGANRFMSLKNLTEDDPDNSETLFDNDAKLINVEEWLIKRDYYLMRTSGQKVAEEQREKIFDLLKGILPDIEKIRYSEITSPEKDSLPKLEFKTPFGWVSLHQLSFGYQSMVAWILDVFARMFKKYPDSSNPLEEPVIILVDEIDLHLHPKWQRQIFDFLEKRFPRAQFIVTAHSPLIVQSAPKNANIIVLKREKIGDEEVIRIDNEVQSVRNWRIDQILSSDLFDVGIRNPEIEKQMDERTALLKKKKLTKIEKERLDELNELSYSLPTANTLEDIEAMEIIRKAAHYLKNQQK